MLWHWFLVEFCGHLLPLPGSYSFWHNGEPFVSAGLRRRSTGCRYIVRSFLFVCWQSCFCRPLFSVISCWVGGLQVVMLVIWAFISFPLALFGTVVGRNWSGQPDNPCRVKSIPRPIPDKKWYLKPSVVALLGGLLPFGSIFIEMYFVFTSFWQYKVRDNH